MIADLEASVFALDFGQQTYAAPSLRLSGLPKTMNVESSEGQVAAVFDAKLYAVRDAEARPIGATVRCNTVKTR